MPYLGRSPTFGQYYTQSLYPDGLNTNFKLDYNAPSSPSVLVSIDGVIQEPYHAYAVSASGDSISFSDAPNASSRIFVTFLGDSMTSRINENGQFNKLTVNNLTVTSANITSNVTLKKISETPVYLGDANVRANINLNSGTVFFANLAANCTFNIDNASAASAFTFVLKNDYDGNSVAWTGGTFLFAGGSSGLSRTTTNNAVDVWAFFTPNSGNVWYVNISMKDVKA